MLSSGYVHAGIPFDLTTSLMLYRSSLAHAMSCKHFIKPATPPYGIYMYVLYDCSDDTRETEMSTTSAAQVSSRDCTEESEMSKTTL